MDKEPTDVLSVEDPEGKSSSKEDKPQDTVNTEKEGADKTEADTATDTAEKEVAGSTTDGQVSDGVDSAPAAGGEDNSTPSKDESTATTVDATAVSAVANSEDGTGTSTPTKDGGQVSDGLDATAAASNKDTSTSTKDEAMMTTDDAAAAANGEGTSTPTKDEAEATDAGNVPYTKQLSKREVVHERYSQKSILISSIFSILCFFPLGIVAVYYGIKVKDAQVQSLRKDYARKSYFWSVAAITTGTVALLLILLVLILGISGVIQ